MRLLQLLLISYLLYRLFLFLLPNLVRLLFKSTIKKQRGPSQQEAYDMLPCSRCGTFVSKAALFSKEGKSFCSEKCRDELNFVTTRQI